MRKILLLTSLAAASCATAPPPASPRAPSPDGPTLVAVWFADADLPKDDMLSGCNLWAPFNFRCVETTDSDRAVLRIYADRHECTAEGNGRHALAWAYPNGKIVFKPDCFKKYLLFTDDQKYRLVMTHETGHELGIEHIPPSCDPNQLEAARTYTGDSGLRLKPHPSGKDVCGRAVLNPIYDSGLHALTEVDGMAFDVRDHDWRITRSLPPVEQASDVPVCTFYDR